MDPLSFATGQQTAFIENLYQSYLKDPESVDSSWRFFFLGYEFSKDHHLTNPASNDSPEAQDHAKVEAFINAYRRLGHLSAHLNPLEPKPAIKANMDPAAHGLKDVKDDQIFHPSNFGSGPLAFKDILQRLQITYCSKIGADFRDINNIEEIVWLQDQMESCLNQPTLDQSTQKRILLKLFEAEGLEKFLQNRYLGQKRFSLEGLESLIPLLDLLISYGTELEAEEFCFGMAHRGRLNVLANIMSKPVGKILLEFEGSEFNPLDIDGDVKYHLGFASEVEAFSGKKARLYLSPNPSHLEAVNPVLEGFIRRRQEVLTSTKKAVPVLLHGDASFIGQGIVHETLNLARLDGYSCGGTIHVITNNQIGFTTNPSDARSCEYSSDIAKVIRAPVMHVNSDDPHAVAWVALLAIRYRQKFGKDFVIDLIGYRKHGHNETDEPGFTQPVMYQKIAKHKGVCTSYAAALIEQKTLAAKEIDEIQAGVKNRLENAYQQVKEGTYKLNWQAPKAFAKVFAYKKAARTDLLAPIKTLISSSSMKELVSQITTLPASFTPHPKIKKLLEARKKMTAVEGAIDWALGELLAYASLAKEGFHVRLTGQDCKRGTFSHRHGILFDEKTEAAYEPLNALEAKGKVTIINSPLSEAGCLGFEFGYSVATPETLVLWEAQFGDFVNGAQIIIDQFLLASEAKWQQTSGLVLLLPHGYEGMGPEHSSARLERFLQGCGNQNIQVASPTTPAQLFHILRRQMLRDFKKPLVLMTPKSLLRHPKVVSKNTDFTKSQFEELLDDEQIKDKSKVSRIIFCTGKIYYELENKRSNLKAPSNQEVAIVRIEQLYPFPKEKLETLFASYPKLTSVVWTQEEPQNMGAFSFVSHRIHACLPKQASLSHVSRKPSGSTAEGSGKSHQIEQQRIIDESFA